MKAEDLIEDEKPVSIVYLCDGKACENCNYQDCMHTHDIRHAVNFEAGKHNDRSYMEIHYFTPNDYQKAALRTANNKDDSYALLQEGLMGLNGEAGECIDILKKYLFQGHELDRKHLAEELGDVAWYLAMSAYAIGYSFEDILKKNIGKLNDRYPDGFDAERSVNR